MKEDGKVKESYLQSNLKIKNKKKKPLINYKNPTMEAWPNVFQFELTEGCNLWCSFCGIRGIRKRPGQYKFMKVSFVEKVMRQLQELEWTVRFELAGRGEPLKNPNYMKILRIIRRYAPGCSIQMCTNGAELLSDTTRKVDELLEVVNILGLDSYDYANIVPRIIERYKGKHGIFYWPERNLYGRANVNSHEIVIIPDISAGRLSMRFMVNQCGASGPLDYRFLKSRCQRLFREIYVRDDGLVPLCCNDWRGEYIVGDLNKETVGDIWSGPRFVAARKIVLHEGRRYRPCLGCTARVARAGMLPDKWGQKTMPMVTSKDRAIVKETLSKGPATIPVLRSWENKEGGIKEWLQKKD